MRSSRDEDDDAFERVSSSASTRKTSRRTRACCARRARMAIAPLSLSMCAISRATRWVLRLRTTAPTRARAKWAASTSHAFEESTATRSPGTTPSSSRRNRARATTRAASAAYVRTGGGVGGGSTPRSRASTTARAWNAGDPGEGKKRARFAVGSRGSATTGTADAAAVRARSWASSKSAARARRRRSSARMAKDGTCVRARASRVWSGTRPRGSSPRVRRRGPGGTNDARAFTTRHRGDRTETRRAEMKAERRAGERAAPSRRQSELERAKNCGRGRASG